MTTYGICNCDLNAYEPKIENLEKFDTYEQAFECYWKRVEKDEHYPYTWDNTLWFVWIEERIRGDDGSSDEVIVQFEQLTTNTKCKLMKI